MFYFRSHQPNLEIDMTEQNYRNAAAALVAMQQDTLRLVRENDLLIKGAANQVKTVRTLTERNSALEAEVTLERYNVEFVKNQGRKTRDKTRALKKQVATLRRDLERALQGQAERSELIEQSDRLIKEQRGDNRQLSALVTTFKQDNARLKDAIERIQKGKELSIQYVTQSLPFRAERVASIPPAPRCFSPGELFRPNDPVKFYERNVVRVTQTQCELHIAPEHRRDVRAHAELAQQVARKMTVAIEQQILNALRGEPTEMPDLAKLKAQELQMKQQRQIYGNAEPDEVVSPEEYARRLYGGTSKSIFDWGSDF